MELWTFVFSGVAAVTASVILIWEWYDRPRLNWKIRFKKVHGSPEEMKVEVHAEGDSIAYHVRARAEGFKHVEYPDRDIGTMMLNGAAPLEMTIRTFDTDIDAYIVIAWISFRPKREHARRMNTRTGVWEEWKWSWSSIRIRATDLTTGSRVPRVSKLLTARIIRTQGQWGPLFENPLARIPSSELRAPRKIGT